MAMLDYGAILKTNGVLKNINQGIFMEMEDAVGFTCDPIKYEYEYDGQKHQTELRINDNYFVYFGDEELLFCVYKHMLTVVTNKESFETYYFGYEDGRKQVKNINIDGTKIKIKRIHGSEKLHAKIQHKGNNYEVIYGYGIDNNVNAFREISRKKRYGYNHKITRYINNFLK